MSAPVIVVSGFPAAGKSTLARRLGRDLGYVVVCRDRLGRALRDVQAQLPHDQRHLVPGALDRIVNLVVEAALDAGHGTIIDGNFNWHEQREPVRQLVARLAPPCVEICLWGDPVVLKARFTERNDPPMDDHLSAVFDLAVARPREPVLGPPTPVFELDATNLGTLETEYPSLLASLHLE